MRRLATTALIAGMLLGATVAFDAPPAGACSCAMGSDAEHYAAADVVFVGDLTDYAAPEPMQSSTDPATWTFAVDRVHKGQVGPTVAVQSAVSGASCGLELPHRGTFVVFADQDGADGLQANLCGGTRAKRAALDPAVFGDGRDAIAAPLVSDEVETSSRSPAPVIAIGATLVVAIALAVWLRQRSRRGNAPLA